MEEEKLGDDEQEMRNAAKIERKGASKRGTDHERASAT